MNMKFISLKSICFSGLCLMAFSNFSTAQAGNVVINQDDSIIKLLELKKEIDIDTDRYKIQIFSGSRFKAEETESDFDSSYNQWSSKLVYETPNYKVWVGSFRTRLESERALIKIKRKFPNAFIFSPPKD